MNEMTDEWVGKAESDFALAHLAMEAGETPLPDGVCFHSQQCAEKYLKAYLTESEVEFPRQHSLIPLLQLCLPEDGEFETLRSDLIQLDGYAAAVRYPGATVSTELAQAALVSAQRVRAFVRRKLHCD